MLFLVVSACSAVSVAYVINSTTQLAVNNDSTASGGHNAPSVGKSAVKSVSELSAASDVYVSKAGDDVTGDGSKAHPYATISKALIMVSSGGNIHILNGVYNEYSLTVDKNVNIIGENQVNTVIDAKGQNNIFIVAKGFAVSIQNLTLTNGLTLNCGGAVRNDGNLTLEDCTLSDNNACYGGAIENYGNLNMGDCTFNANIVSKEYFEGSAIRNDGTMAASGCTFTRNNATVMGSGTIYNKGTITSLSGCTFTGNNAQVCGGAVDNEGIINMVGDCTFINNTAYTFAGAIYNGGTVTVRDCTFTGNNATQGGGGGAIVNGGTMTVSGCTFTGNNATTSGGAIDNEHSGAITAYFNRFVNNTAAYGSAVYNAGVSVDAKYNWWGSNKDPSGKLYNVNYGPWLVLTINSTSAKTVPGSKATVTADLQHDSNSVYHDPSGGHLMDGTVVSFSTDNGSLDPITANLVNGSVVTVFTAKAAVSASVNATFDDETATTQMVGGQLKTSLTAEDMAALPGKAVSLAATLKDENGKPLVGKSVDFDVNGTTGSVVTDAFGVAVFNYTPSKLGTFDWTTKFAGDSDYVGSDAKALLTVSDKLKTSLTTGNATTSPGKVVGLAATLKDENGKPLAAKTVNFVVDGVTGSVVTDASGVAMFKYTTSKEGVYTFKTSFAGNNNYLSSAAAGVLTVNGSKPVKPDSGSGDDSSAAAGGVNKSLAAGVIGMLKTGLPLNCLVLAILAVFGGLIILRKKN